MKFSLLALPTFIAVTTAGTLDDLRAQRRLNNEFMHAMHSNPRISQAQKKSRAQKIQDLHKNLMNASRKLASSNNYANSGQSGQYQQYQQQYNNGQGQYNNGYQDGQAYSNVATWNGEYWEFGGEDPPFDLTSRAFKYSGCAAIKTYDVDRANSNGNPMVLDTYAVFRLCPADKCNKYSVTGCGKNYGEYAVEMKTYLQFVLGFYDERYEEFCGYCAPCDWEYQAEYKNALQQCYSEMQQDQYMQAQEAQQQAWLNYYNANGGDMSGWNVNNQGNANGDQNFQNYNNYYNQAHSYNGMYSNYGSGNGASYSGNSDNGNRKLEDAAGDGAAQGGYYDEYGNWVQGQGNNYANNYYNNANYQNQQDGNNAASQGNGYWGADGKFYSTYTDDQYYQTDLVQCQDGSMCDQCHALLEETYFTCDDYICGDYYTYCSELYTNNQGADIDVTEFLECAEFKAADGSVYYVGPHCGSDHYTISLGVFSDENCLVYVGDSISLSSVLGFKYNDEDLFKLPKECISCDGTEEYEEAQANGQTEGRYGPYYTTPETDENNVVAVCRALYEGSAQCNMNMNNFDTISRYMSQYELDVEKRYCSFIENIIYGAYDESGDILLKPENFDFADWRNPRQYRKLRMPVGQAIFLSFSIIAAVAAAAAAAFTHRSMTRTSSPWRPKRLTPEELAKTQSGIGISRVRSGPGIAPLI